MNQKTYLAKVDQRVLKFNLLPDPVSHFRVGGEVLQAVRCCRWCGVAGGERVPPAPLGWYNKRNHESGLEGRDVNQNDYL